ncbi:SAM-dependent methyltransferase, partial [Vibrio anguillarum]|nr:SAM-dependent methyltransferase [Vibrio anguillarum]
EVHQKHFKQIKILKLAERFFKEEGAKETSIILLAEGFHKKETPQSNLSVNVVGGVSDLKQAIANVDAATSLSVKDYKLNIISSGAKLSYRNLLMRETTKELSEYVDIKIGMVTGANNYFIINRSTAAKHQLPEDVLKPVVGRFRYLQGIIHDKHRHKKSAKADQRVYLVCPTEEQMADTSSRVFQYLSEISLEERQTNRTFKKRPHWFVPGWGIDGLKADC